MIRGESCSGGLWQRPQFACKARSPGLLAAATACCADGEDACFVFCGELDACAQVSKLPTESTANGSAEYFQGERTFFMSDLATWERENGTSERSPRYSHCR